MTLPIRYLAAAATTAAGLLAARIVLRYLRHAEPGTIGVLIACGKDDHGTCLPRCRAWRRGFAVPSEYGMDLWHLYATGSAPYCRVATADLPVIAIRVQTLATDFGPVRLVVIDSHRGLVAAGPDGPRPAATFGGPR